MGRPHAPDEPLVASASTLTNLAQMLGRGSLGVRAVVDGRTIVLVPGFHQSHHWVGRDLACPCGNTDAACLHQVTAALARRRPVQVQSGREHPMLANLVARLPILLGAHPVHDGTEPERPQLAHGWALTRPDRTAADDTVEAHLSTTLRTAPLLAIAGGRTPGPARDALWTRWIHELDAYPVVPPHREIRLVLTRLLLTASDGELVTWLGGAPSPTLVVLLDEILPATPVLTVHLGATLPAPAVAALLARTRSRELRLALARGASRRTGR